MTVTDLLDLQARGPLGTDGLQRVWMDQNLKTYMAQCIPYLLAFWAAAKRAPIWDLETAEALAALDAHAETIAEEEQWKS